jgi:hypothetical protein
MDDIRAKLNAQLKQMGCPYRVGDPRVEAWHEGYRAGLGFARRAA